MLMFIFILLISIRTITNSLSASCKLLNWQVSIMLMIKGRRRTNRYLLRISTLQSRQHRAYDIV